MTVTPFETRWMGGPPGYTADRHRLFDMADVMRSPADSLGPVEGIVQGGIPTITGSTVVLPASVFRVRNPAAGQGVYTRIIESPWSQTIVAQPSSGSRVDLLYLACGSDPNTDDSTVNLVTGVAAASPAAPFLPSAALLLGTIAVPTAGSGSPVITPSRWYSAAPGAVLPWTSSRGQLPPLRPGQIVKQLDQSGNSEWVTQDDTHGLVPLWDSIGRDWGGYGCLQTIAPNSTPSWVNLVFGSPAVATSGSGGVGLDGSGRLTFSQGGFYEVSLFGNQAGGSGGTLPGSEVNVRGLINGDTSVVVKLVAFAYSPFNGNHPIDYVGNFYVNNPGYLLMQTAQNTGASRMHSSVCWLKRVGP